MNTIVVGVDGSACSDAALRFAVEEAALRKAKLRIVSAWEVPTAAYGAGFAPVDSQLFESFRLRAEAVVEEAAEAVRSREPQVELETRVEEGQPAAVLLESARDATLIVVGTRGLGGF
ncbi:MAG TPA: universal stress protein, partial [Planctomycetaceae bacterium]